MILDRILVAISIAALTITVALMHGRMERFDMQISQLEDCVFNGKGCYNGKAVMEDGKR